MPRYGFNFLWMFIYNEGDTPPPPDLPALDLLADVGLRFVRIPTDYNFWTTDFDYFHPDIAMPELADLGVIHSGRGYQPMALTHYQANWWSSGQDLPEPTYPLEWNDRLWNREALHQHYEPWRQVREQGVQVHIHTFNRTG